MEQDGRQVFTVENLVHFVHQLAAIVWVGGVLAVNVLQVRLADPVTTAPARVGKPGKCRPVPTSYHREVRVRKIAVQMYMSVDGVMGAPEKWSFPYWTDDHEQYAYQRLLAADALLLGRATYQAFAASWPLRTGDDFADRMNSLPKYVVSSTLGDQLEWNNSRAIRGDIVAEVTKLRQQPGRDILLYGSRALFNTLLDHHLIDDLRLWVFPLVLGRGMRLFAGHNEPGNLQLADTTTFSTGVAVLCYEPAGNLE